MLFSIKEQIQLGMRGASRPRAKGIMFNILSVKEDYMRGYSIIGLDNPKTPANIGSAMRAVGVYGASGLFFTGRRIKPGNTDAMKHYRHIPLINVPDLHMAVPYDCVPVAVELINDAIPLPEYKHPERAFYVFGAEDDTLGDRILSWCRDIVYIPTAGCMNLAATVNVVLYDRLQKQIINHSSEHLKAAAA